MEHRVYPVRWLLVLYDTFIFTAVAILLFVIYRGSNYLNSNQKITQLVIAFIILMASRFIFKIYKQVWRYGGIQSYIRLIASDAFAFAVYLLTRLLPFEKLTAVTTISLFCMTLLGSLVMRMLYRYTYKFGNLDTKQGKILRALYRIFSGKNLAADVGVGTNKINIAIIGAGRVGASLATDLMTTPGAAYIPRCYIDINQEKIGKQIFGIPVFSEDSATTELLAKYEIQEVVVAITSATPEQKKKIYDHYKSMDFKVKIYDYPTMRTAGSKMQLREFDIDELLFRKELDVTDEKTALFYKDKVVMVTGGGGSIGSEICRQISSMNPKRLVILDVYENGAYDLQQELKLAMGDALSVYVEIISICNREALERVFEHHRPQIVIHAAAHKHVPLMENNCIEAIENNIFGSFNVVEMCEKYGSERFMMVSTDKAVNPTNVMGATKRMCEMIVQAHSQKQSCTKFSATRFGNVLGSAGSVVPLFKKEIANGGPITITDKRIIRYFMTIPEATSLVLQSGAMAKNGELFVLDMGQPVKILDLAENLIRLSGLEPYKDIDIIETGLRPGEKLYEELLVGDEGLDKTDNKMIFIERDTPLPLSKIEECLAILRSAVDSGDEAVAKEALKSVVPTYKSPEAVNRYALQTEEFKNTRMFSSKLDENESHDFPRGDK